MNHGTPLYVQGQLCFCMGISYGVEWGKESEAAYRDSAVLARLFSYLRLILT